MSYFVQINPEKLTEDARRSAAIVELTPFSHRMAFVSNELAQRGFFGGNNLSQVSSGQLQLPLLTWPFLDFLAASKLNLSRLVELGSGNSTLWFARLFAQVVSFETHPEWCEQIRKRVPENCQVNLVSESELLECKMVFDSSDWLLVDFAGRRSQFIKNMLTKHSTALPGVVVLDNADWYRTGARFLHDAGYVEIPFFGFKSGQTHLSCTSIFLKDASILQRQDPTFRVPRFCRSSVGNSWDVVE
jgi:hypothetical protein